MQLTHSTARLSCLITPSVQEPETTEQTPVGTRLIHKRIVRIFLMLTELITEFTFHLHISSPSLRIGRATVICLHVRTGSERRAEKQTSKQEHVTKLPLMTCSPEQAEHYVTH